MLRPISSYGTYMVHTVTLDERPFLNLFLNIVNRGGRPEYSPLAKMRWRGGCGNLRGGIWRGGLRASEDRTSICPKVEFERGCWNTNSKRVARKMREYNIDNNCMCSVHQWGRKYPAQHHRSGCPVAQWSRDLASIDTWWVEQVRDHGAATIFSTICK